MNNKRTATRSSLYVVSGKLVLNEKAKTWCKLPYPDHPHGCPNYGKKDVCPPRAPDVRECFDIRMCMHFVVARFDLEAHIAKMHERLPHWSERQCRNLLYWQGGVTRALRSAVWDLFYRELQSHEMKAAYVPEAMGVDVLETCRTLGIPIERNPVKYVHKVALVGKPKNETR